jgi:TonB family protein
VVIRYANRRSSFRPVTGAERSGWEASVERPLLAAGLNFWWQWVSTIDQAPEMSEGERRFFAERIFPAQGHVLDQEAVRTESLRNAILRVGERRLLESRTVQRVAPSYPAAARQAGIGGLVVVLAYVQADGEVGDALILASNTVHLLNLAALTAAMDWRFARTEDGVGNPVDGWRLVPFQFLIAGPASEGSAAAVPEIVLRGELDYPFEAKRQKIKGTVVYRVAVDERGKLVEAVLEQGVHPLIDQAALEAVEKTRFLPATRDGVPVPGQILMSFEFKEELD